MSNIEDAITQVAVLGEKEVFLECTDEKNQESTRTITYHVKKKMLTGTTEIERIGISKITAPNGRLFVRVYKRPILNIYKRNSEGEFVLFKTKKEDDPELKRIIRLMKEDGKSAEEIQKYVDEWEEPEEEKLKNEDEELKNDVERIVKSDAKGRAAEKEAMRDALKED